MSEVDQLNRMRALRAQHLEAEICFFTWWKKAVDTIGYKYFGDGTKQGFDSAVNKNDLRPDRSQIEATLEYRTEKEVAFITAVYCFYNDTAGREISIEAGMKSFGDVTSIDHDRREILAGLLTSYNGW